jgi:predicted AAA+ superfamily ATPase
MQQLYTVFYKQLSRVDTGFKRYLYDEIRWQNRLIAIVGSRGTGKTTLLLQHIKLNYTIPGQEVLYASLDNLWFSTHTLTYMADEFTKQGGKILYLDEVHNYSGWSREIKNIYDSYPDLKIVFTGSSLLEVYKGEADLSRRVVMYHLHGLSFREFIDYEYGEKFTEVSFEHILLNHTSLAQSINNRIKPLVAFGEYLRYGYFPYYKEDKEMYPLRLLSTLNTIIEQDLPAIERIDYYSVVKIKRLFAVLASLVPYTPNVSQLSNDIGITRISLMNYLYYLSKAEAILLLTKVTTGIKQLTKPDKVYLGNTNYAYALAGTDTNIGSVRESFFMNQVRVRNDIQFGNEVDFLVSEKYWIEIGGKNKTKKQLSGLENAYTAVDNIEFGYGNQIPLWLFGFTY